LAMLAASCLPNGVKVRILILLLEHRRLMSRMQDPSTFNLAAIPL
jgi:hypothetical protein